MSYVGTDFAPPSAPGEVEWYAFDFSAILAAGETILTASWLVEAIYPNGNGIPNTSGTPSIKGGSVAYLLAGLSVGVNYLLTATVSTSLGAVLILYSHVYCQAPN